jgi:hypothetical protein
MKIGEIVYYARILPKTGEHELVQLRVRSIRPTYFSCVCTDNSKQSYIFDNEDLEDVVFEDIAKAKELLNKRGK